MDKQRKLLSITRKISTSLVHSQNTVDGFAMVSSKVDHVSAKRTVSDYLKSYRGCHCSTFWHFNDNCNTRALIPCDAKRLRSASALLLGLTKKAKTIWSVRGL